MQPLDSFKFHWKAPLQTKGFLKIIEFFLAILSFSLVSGFNINGHIRCAGDTKDAVTVAFNFPYSKYSYLNNNSVTVTENFRSGAAGPSQYFVAWGVLSMLYAMVALGVYIVFTANEKLEKVVDILVYVDLGFNISFALNWFIASVEWTVGFRAMPGHVMTVLNIIVPNCGGNLIVDRSQDTYEQAAIGAVFGFLCFFIWTANIYWVLIDTALFIKWREGAKPYQNLVPDNNS